jgi:hypothetical protein
MNRRVPVRQVIFSLLVLSLLLISCRQSSEPQSSGPATTTTSSDAIASLDQRIDFLQKYVTFRRQYQEVAFHIEYHNNGTGLIPGPSDWDVRIVAVVPPEELELWVSTDVKAIPTTDVSWLATVPEGAMRTANITEWYVEPGRIIGVDRKRSIVAYRSWSQ